jgi:hypothetical protein
VFNYEGAGIAEVAVQKGFNVRLSPSFQRTL